ncbi:hypothetical protein AMTRI_Chr02g212720 [Amborella trichopoda]|uniref:Pentacotripeptide-repeat region of PRORP domain-containing protein n=1 Tax=Amborella trichopoda TaxID=13333 RepID=U5D328_AMBTC|nr:pentatricopeptide repeat-containing protein At4g20770 [Amborella trichopoda]ERN14763.1 hypothetical protein AMTR_s00032p00029450 [Amborella trichopoda]|eukprot:XP_020528527.1 pentatricopeptide repeat-containing protein At4g20770 [Amborella trichopoda]
MARGINAIANTCSPISTHFASLLQAFIDKKKPLSSAKSLHAQIFKCCLSSDIFLSNKLIELYSKMDQISVAHKVFDKMPHKNIYSWNAIVGAYCKSGEIDEANQLFLKMPQKNTVSWNTLIGGLVRSGFDQKALNTYSEMNIEGIKPTHFTFASVLSACGNLQDSCKGIQVHGRIVRDGLELNTYVENALVSMYAKSGSMAYALQLFREMKEPNEVSCTAIMSGLALTDSLEKAFMMFREMLRHGIKIDEVALSGILGICVKSWTGGLDLTSLEREISSFEIGFSGLEQESGSFHVGLCGLEQESGSFDLGFSGYLQCTQIHALAIRAGFQSSLIFGNSLLDMYVKFGDMGSAESVFMSSPELNVVSWNVMIAGYGSLSLGERAMELLREMQELGFAPDGITYSSMLGACVKSNLIQTARTMFDKLESPSVSSWNTIISGYFKRENYEEAINLFREMQLENTWPDRTTLTIMLSSCGEIGFLDGGKQVHSFSLKMIVFSDLFVGSGLIDMYSKCGKIDHAKFVFDRMEERDVVGWNSMIAGFAINALNTKAFSLFKEMQRAGMMPTQFSYASVISSCTTLASIAQGRQLHGQIIKAGFLSDIFVNTAIIDMYSKCGNIEGAFHTFSLMPKKNIVSWNEMINGFAQNGCADKALEIFREMIKTDKKPDHITFIAVLTACSHGGLVEEGLNILHSMESQYKITPMADHYACVVDCLGRAGRLEEGENLINGLQCPYSSDPIIWGILLSACRVYGNISVGKRSAEKLFCLDPDNPAPYVLLSNIYAEIGRWDVALAVRKLMRERGVVKNPGRSWIEVRSGIRALSVDDSFMMADDELRCENSER